MTSLHICTSASWGGLELYTATLILALRNEGREVIAICVKDSPLHSYLAEREVRCAFFPSRRKISLRSILFLRAFVERESVAEVHAHFHNDIWIPSIALRMPRDPRRKLFLSIYMGVMKKKDPLHRWIYQRVDAIFTSSRELNNRLPSLYPVPKDKIHFLPYGRNIGEYDLQAERREAIRRGMGIGPEETVIGTMVRIDPGKGALDFARSILYLGEDGKKVRYVVVGEPTRKAHRPVGESPYESHCEEYLASLRNFISESHLEKKVLLPGFQKDFIGYLSAFDVFVFPSRDEMYSLVVLDAMCLGLPVVAARAGGTVLQIEEGVNGFLYEPANSEDLAVQLKKYIADVRLRRKHGAAARQFVEKQHAMTLTVKELLRWYGEN